MKHSSFDATISALDAELLALLRGGHSMRRYWRSMLRCLRSVRRHRRSHGVFTDIGNCGVGITPQMCNRVTNHGDMGTFSKPDYSSLHSGQSLAFHHFCGDSDDPCHVIADFCRVIPYP